MTRQLVFVACLFASFLLASAYSPLELRRQLRSQGYKEIPSILGSSFVKGEERVLVEYHDKFYNQEVVDDLLNLGRKMLGINMTNVGFYDFLPATAGILMNGGTVSWQSRCFESISATGHFDSDNATVTISVGKKRELVCEELYVFGTRSGGHFELLGGKATLVIPWQNPGMASAALQYGLGIFVFPYSLEYTAASIAKTAMLFWDPNPNFIELNQQFLAERMQWATQERPINHVNLTEDQIQNGDYLGIFRADGLDPMIMWGTGSHTGHTAVALWFPDGLHICESTDTFGVPVMHYWPPPYGVIRTPFAQWVKQAQEANYHVAIARLHENYSKIFNATAAVNWFNSVQGQPYGYHNFLFTFIDTMNDNLPRPITQQLFEVVVYGWQRLFPIDAQGSIYNMMIQGLNHRLNSNCTTLECIYEIIDPKGMTLMQVAAMPEQDSWRYGGNYSMVCSVFVTELYKNAGIFGSLTDLIQGTEQAPKDTYQMALYDAAWQRPKECVEADPALPYCQIMGKWVLTLPGFNSFPPYAYINEACGSLPPVYYRADGC